MCQNLKKKSVAKRLIRAGDNIFFSSQSCPDRFLEPTSMGTGFLGLKRRGRDAEDSPLISSLTIDGVSMTSWLLSGHFYFTVGLYIIS